MKFNTLVLGVAMAFSGMVSAGSEGIPSQLPVQTLPDGFSGVIGVSTDVVFRGVSLSDEGFGYGGGVTYKHDKNDWYVGALAVTTDGEFAAEDWMTAFYGGWEFEFMRDPCAPGYFQITRYDPDYNGVGDLAFWEFEFGIAQRFSDSEIGFSVAYSPDYFNVFDDSVHTAVYAEYNELSFPIDWDPEYTDNWTVGIAGGYTKTDVDNYANWKLYLDKRLDNGFGLELSYHDTNGLSVVPADIADNRYVATVSYLF